MSRVFDVGLPAQRAAGAGEDRAGGLGRLGEELVRLADRQGAWPPSVPENLLPVVASAPPAPGGAAAVPDAFDAGAALADDAADRGAPLLLVDPAADAVAGLTAVAAVLDLDPVAAVGTGGGASWAGLVAGVRDRLRSARSHPGDPMGLLADLGDPHLAWQAGLLAQSAVRRTPLLLGGPAAPAALLAERLAPGAARWWLAAAGPAAPAGRLAWDHLGLRPLLGLELPGPGGAQLAAALLRAAVALLDDGPAGG